MVISAYFVCDNLIKNDSFHHFQGATSDSKSRQGLRNSTDSRRNSEWSPLMNFNNNKKIIIIIIKG